MLSGTQVPVVDFDSMVFIQLGLFFVLFFLLKKFVFEPTMAVLDARYAAMDGAKKDAAALSKKADAKFAAFESEMMKVRSEAQLERARIRKEATELEREVLAKAKQDTDAMLSEADATLKREGAKIRRELSAETSTLVKLISDRVLAK